MTPAPHPYTRTTALAVTWPVPLAPGGNARYGLRRAHTKAPRPRQNQLPRTGCLEETLEPRNPLHAQRSPPTEMGHHHRVLLPGRRTPAFAFGLLRNFETLCLVIPNRFAIWFCDHPKSWRRFE